MKLRCLSVLLLLSAVAFAENEIGFIEKFALAPDREAVLTQLVPGTEDYYFFHALHAQNTRAAARLRDVLEQWGKRFPNSERRTIIENREALLSYDADPQATLKFLRERLKVDLNHVQEARDQRPDLPVVLDPARIARSVFAAEALQHDDLEKLSIAGLEQLVRDKAKLRPAQIRALLSKLERPDLPGLVELVAAELKTQESGGFGSFKIHRALLPQQLEALQNLIPALTENEAFVLTRLQKLLPGADADMEFDPTERDAWLRRAWDYVKTLPPAFPTLKASVLRQRLEFDRERGALNKVLFIEYLKLPRAMPYVNPRYLEAPNRSSQVDVNRGFTEAGLPLPPIGTDEALVRELFLLLFVTEETWEPYAQFVRDTWLKPIFAEAKIVNGIGDPERWAALLSPAAFQRLKERVDVEFTHQNPKTHAPADDVSVRLFVKNAPKLIVKIYELNTLSYFLAEKRQLNTDLNLDGLVANVEQTVDLTAADLPPADRTAAANPFRRVERVFPFPELKGRGAWMIEFIGGGKSSRALIRKGQWTVLAQAGPAGDLLTVLDETRTPVKDAAVWLDGRRFTANEKTGGRVLVPFTSEPGRKQVVLADAAGTFATLAEFEHHGESYALDAQFHLEHEQLLASREATVAVRAGLLVNDAQISLDVLQEPKLRISTTTLDGLETSSEVSVPKFTPDGVLSHKFKVPERLAQLVVSLTGKVKLLSKGGEEQELSASRAWSINGIDKTEHVRDSHLSKIAESYVYELLGKNGEPLADQQVVFRFTHRDFPGVDRVQVPLRPDERGRVNLGRLDEIKHLQASAPGAVERSWPIREQWRTRPSVIHAKAGEPIEIPWARDLEPGSYSVLEVRGGTFVADRSNHILIPPLGPYRPGPTGKPVPGLKLPALKIESLPPGDYSLRLREEGEDREITLRVTAGEPVQGWLLGVNRELQLRDAAPLHIGNVKVGGDAIEVILMNVNEFTRVHVAATRFLPGEGLLQLANFQRFTPESATPERLPSLYSAERRIGDEFRYILERRYAAKFPGNLLTRPGLLLNPWEKRSTDLHAQSQSATQSPASTAGARGRRAAPARPEVQKAFKSVSEPAPDSTRNLNFLATAAPVLLNLKPDAQGIVRIDRKLLGDRQHVQVYAEDLANAAWRSFAVEEVPAHFQDLRLVRNLDPAKPFTEKKEVAVLTAGQALKLQDVLTSEVQIYDSLGSVYTLLRALNANPTFVTFAWLLDWPKLNPEEKRARYSEFACHELSFFLSRKDPQFFAEVVQPYLRNKKDKTFLDDYLLGNELGSYLEPWSYSRLNVVERALIGQRLPAEAAHAAKHLRELWEMLPPNVEEQDRLFETALRSRSVTGADDVSGVFQRTREEADRSKGPSLELAKRMPADAPEDAAAARSGRAAIMDSLAAYSIPADGKALHPAAPASAPAAAIPGLEPLAEAEAAAMAKKDSAGKDEFSDSSLGRGVVNRYFANEEVLAQRQLGLELAYYRRLGATKEWAENNYYKLPIEQQNAELVTINAFWRDFGGWVAAGAKAPFLSPHIAEAHRSFTECMLALAVLDLPFEAPEHQTQVDGGTFAMTASGATIAFHKQIKPATPAAEATELLVSQNFYRRGDRYRQEGNEKLDKYVVEEFLSGVVYGANIVVTNPTSAPQKLDLLLQIPRGALPVNGSKATDSRQLRLEPYTTQQLEYYFYFPAPREQPFPHYPVHIAKAEQIVGAAKPLAFHVVRQLSQIDKASWEYVSQYGTDADVFAFLEQQNIRAINLERVAWRARQNVDFFRKVQTLLAQRHTWSEPIYRYALLHNEAAPLREWLRHHDAFLKRCGPLLEAKLVRIDPIERRAYEHLEYSPLVNQRVHRLGSEAKIANPVFREQYQSLLNALAHKPQLDAMDQMSVVYYLFLQDRVEEALSKFEEIDPGALPVKLQHDYFRCYAAFYTETLPQARQIAAQYLSFPIERWRMLFSEVAAQLDEIEGKAAQRLVGKEPDREQQQAELAATEATFDFKVENRSVALTWRNLREVTVNYYLMDPEFLFSANPFVNEDSSRFSFIKPTKSDRHVLPEGRDAADLPLPPEFAKANVLVEILGAGQRKAQAYHANTFKLALAENYGRLDLLDQAAGKAVSKAYVKVYARLNDGQIRFFKDGYTDLRGKFDYASLNSIDSPAPPQPMPRTSAAAEALGYQMLRPDELPHVQRLAILVLSDAHGATVKEVGLPTQ